MKDLKTPKQLRKEGWKGLNLKREPFESRSLGNSVFSVMVWLLALIAAVPLLSIIYMLLSHGGARLFSEFVPVFTELPPAGFEMGGGIGPAIVGTLIMVAIASTIAVPMGILTAISIKILGRDSTLGRSAHFTAKVLTGFPSILSGVFVYAVLVIKFGYSALAGGVALAVLMLPTIIIAAEEALGQVPKRMTDAAYGMGCTPTQVMWKITLPTALPGIMTGVMLAVAGAAGESAPLLFTALFSNYYLSHMNEPTASLSVLIYNFSGMPFDNQIELAWTASLVLVIIVLIFNLFARAISRKKN
ncbi:phosphate ABC transporter permease PstA [Microbulbifer elongatus]|uniref:Phosphate transport system permease protein PstA n=1 Tax=Microbulbifer elongatus TaxID=86173 RepID=A0ABT1P249_9GAMM|nr:phosphate ABC transporter permease PstA [Microbulbifer elongatus]MCQ3830166.1 phosphate ABC transporter permease PstA [Microbulbifer elongatus]